MPTVHNQGVELYYEVMGKADGDKPPIIFAHGMGGNAAIWFNQLAHYGESHQVVAFDHRYFGRSACSVDMFDPAAFPSDAMAIMDAIGIESAIWVCQSMGGWTGSQLAVHHPERVTALVMSHTPGIFEHESAVNDTARLAKTIESGFLPALAKDFPIKNPTMATLYGSINRFNDIENAVISRSIGKANLGVNTESLTGYSIPTLFVTGDKDVLFEAGFVKALAAKVPGAQFVNLGDVGHSSYFELPEAFNDELDKFIESLPQ